MGISRKSAGISAALATLFLSLLGAQHVLLENAQAVSNDRLIPHFEVDPFWPQPLPNKWILGRTIGIAVDDRDHLFVVHRDQDNMFMNQALGLD